MGRLDEIIKFIKISNLKIGDFRILDPERAIFDETDFGQKISKCTTNKEAYAKNHTFITRKRSKNEFFKNTSFFYALYDTLNGVYSSM